MCAKQDRGSVPDLAPIRTLRHCSPLFDQRRTRNDFEHRSYGRRSGRFFRRPAEADVDFLGSVVARMAPRHNVGMRPANFGKIAFVCRA